MKFIEKFNKKENKNQNTDLEIWCDDKGIPIISHNKEGISESQFDLINALQKNWEEVSLNVNGSENFPVIVYPVKDVDLFYENEENKIYGEENEIISEWSVGGKLLPSKLTMPAPS